MQFMIFIFYLKNFIIIKYLTPKINYVTLNLKMPCFVIITPQPTIINMISVTKHFHKINIVKDKPNVKTIIYILHKREKDTSSY